MSTGMSTGALHRWWARNGWRLILVAVTVAALTRAYMMWRHLPGDALPLRTGI